MATIPGGNPVCLGDVTVAAAGTPVNVTANFPDLEANDISTKIEKLCSKIIVQARWANTLRIYFGKPGIDPAVADANIIAALDPGERYELTDEAGLNAFDITDFQLDADTSGNSAFVSYVSR